MYQLIFIAKSIAMAKLIDELSHSAAKSELNYFQSPPTQTAIEKSDWYCSQIIGGVKQDGPFRFELYSSKECFDLYHNYLYIQMKVVEDDGTEDGKNIADDAKVAPINLLGTTFFKQCIVRIGDEQVYDSNNLYAYRTYLETVLNYGSEAKNNQLQLAFYYKDTPSQFDSIDNNTGAKQRLLRSKNSKSFATMAPIHCDIFNNDKLMLSDTKISLELHRHEDKFLLVDCTPTKKYKIRLEDMKWYVKKSRLQPSLGNAIDSIMRNNNLMAKFPFRRVKMVNRKIHQPAGEITKTDIFDGQLPRRIFFGVVPSNAFNGEQGKNPFNFLNANIEEVKLTVDGEEVPKFKLKMNFTNDLYQLPYAFLMESLGYSRENKTCDIDMNDYKGGSCLFGFNLSADESDDGAFCLVKHGKVNITIDFSTTNNIKDGVELIVYGEFDNMISMNQNREVFADYKL